jgi:photosystem II stability/assembly factor-like uncharacterized protein
VPVVVITGTIYLGLAMKTVFLFIIFCLNIYSQEYWTKLNGPEGGTVTSLISKGDTLVAAIHLDYGRIFYSFDRGNNWSKSNISLNDRSWDLIFADDGSIIAAADLNGLYRSYDLVNWEKIFSAYHESFRRLGIDYIGNLYTGTEYFFSGPAEGSIYISSNNGLSWSIEYRGAGGQIGDLFTAPGNRMLSSNSKNILFKDTDSSWKNIPFDTLSAWFQFTEDDSSNIYSFIGGPIFISSDTGSTWHFHSGVGSFWYGNSMYDMIYNERFIGAFLDETPWFGDGWGAAVSDDGGINWRWSQTGLPPLVCGVRLAKSGSDTYLGTMAAGVFRSTDYGESWFSSNKGLTGAEVMSLFFDKEGTLYTASWGSGLSKSTDGGQSWMMINNGVNNVYFRSIISDDQGNLIAGSDEGTFRSTDKGENWISTAVPGGGVVFQLRKDKFDRIYAMSSRTGIFRTTDAGISWTRIDKHPINANIYGFAIDSSGNIYAGGPGGRIYKTVDDGNTWTIVYQGASGAIIDGITISPNGSIFAAILDEGIFRSTDNGLTWQKKSGGIPVSWVSRVAVNEKEEVYFYAHKSGIYKSVDNGESWINITGNLNFTEIKDFVFYKDETYLATSESVWKGRPDTVTSIASDEYIQKNYFLSQNYPNPFNPSTTIKYSLAEAGRVTLSIYDLLGREVIKLIDEEKPAGEYEIKWNASGYPSGVYFLRMHAGQFSDMRKLLLMK